MSVSEQKIHVQTKKYKKTFEKVFTFYPYKKEERRIQTLNKSLNTFEVDES